MKPATLGKLQRVKLDEWFKHENDFTTWLARNMAALGNAIRLPLEVEIQEKKVGPFKADLLCKIKGTDKFVVIENQFKQSDHAHLGKLLTYSAGLGAQGIVWIAEEFTEQHRSVFEWLNENTTTDLKAFAVKIQLERIDNSAPAPRFEVIAMPNNWEKDQRTKVAEISYSDRQKCYLKFWRGFDKYIQGTGLNGDGTPKPLYYRFFEIGRPGFRLAAGVFEDGGLYVELIIKGAERISRLNQLARNRTAIERAIGTSLRWEKQKDGPHSKIAADGDFDRWDETKWPIYYEWLRKTLKSFYDTFQPRVREF